MNSSAREAVETPVHERRCCPLWLRAVDWFLPERLLARGPDEIRRARAVVLVAALSAVFFFWLACRQIASGIPIIGFNALAVAVLITLVPPLMRATASLRLAANSFSLISSVSVLCVAAARGGEGQISVFTACLVPLLAVLLGGFRTGLIWGLITCVSLAALAYAVERGVEFPTGPYLAEFVFDKFLGAIFLSVLTLAAAFLYEWLKSRALREVAEASSRAETEHRERLESELRFRTLADRAFDTIAELDAYGRILYISPRVQDILGTPAEEFTQTYWYQHIGRVHPEDIPLVPEALQRALEMGVGTEASVRVRHEDGRWRIIEATVQAFETAQKKLHLVVVGRDVTERREIETLRQLTRQLEATAGDLARANRELDEFTSIASHDLQEPLRKLVSFSELLREDAGPVLPAAAEQDLAFITDAARRMQKLVRDLLELSRAGSAALKPEPIDVGQCIERVLEGLELQVVENNARILRDPLPVVVADPTLLELLYQNLISNALKFSDGSPPLVHLTAEGRDGEWVLGVCDQGIGIRPDQTEEIFKPFRRLHPRGVYEGTGIGLAICRKAVERHGGRIWVESEDNRGTHFRFVLGEGSRVSIGVAAK